MKITRITLLIPLGAEEEPLFARTRALYPGIPVDARLSRRAGVEFNGGNCPLSAAAAQYEAAKAIFAKDLRPGAMSP